MILALFLIFFSNLGIAAPHQMACRASLPEKSISEKPFLKKVHCESALSEWFPLKGSRKIVEGIQADKDFKSFLTESAQKQTVVLESKEFQETVGILKDPALQPQASPQISQVKHQLENANPTRELFLFVSFSLGEKALLNLAHEAKIYGASLVLRGFKDNSYAQTVKALQKIIQETDQGFIIDPELFSLFSVTAVPTTILSRSFQIHAVESKALEPTTPERIQTMPSGVRPGGPIHDRIQGHVNIRYALEQFSKEGDLQNEALFLLEQAKKGRSNE